MPTPSHNPLAGESGTATFAVNNPTQGNPPERPIQVRDVFWRVRGADGSNADFAHTGAVTIPVAGYHYSQSKVFAAGSYNHQPVVIDSLGEIVAAAATLTVATESVGAWTAWALSGDGTSSTRSRAHTFSDGSTAVTETETVTWQPDGSGATVVSWSDGRPSTAGQTYGMVRATLNTSAVT